MDFSELIKNYDLKVIEKESTVSTNNDGKELIKNGINRPVLITSLEQTGGRGRQGKSFLSPKGGLYMTLVLPVSLPFQSSVTVTSCISVAVINALDQFGINSGIKWVNDIYSDNRKLAGILVEAENNYENQKTTALIIGIGINIETAPIFDGEVKAIALNEIKTVTRTQLCAEITKNILEMKNNYFNFKNYFDTYRNRSIVINKKISYSKNSEIHYARVLGIGDQGELLIEENGSLSSLSSGEISIRI